MANMDILPIIVFALFFGAALTTLGKRAEPVIDFFDGVNGAMMKLADCGPVRAVCLDHGSGSTVAAGCCPSAI